MKKLIQKYSNVILLSTFAVCAVCILFLPLRYYKIIDTGYTLWIPLLVAMVNTTFKSGGYTFTFMTDMSLIAAIIAVCILGMVLMCFSKTYIFGVAATAAGGLMTMFSDFVLVTANGHAGELHTSSFVIIIYALMMFMAVIKAVALFTSKEEEIE